MAKVPDLERTLAMVEGILPVTPNPVTPDLEAMIDGINLNDIAVLLRELKALRGRTVTAHAVKKPGEAMKITAQNGGKTLTFEFDPDSQGAAIHANAMIHSFMDMKPSVRQDGASTTVITYRDELSQHWQHCHDFDTAGKDVTAT